MHRAEDCQHVAKMFDEDDTGRSSLIASFAEKGRFSPGDVDFTVPYCKAYRTCRGGAAMREAYESKKGYAFIFELALAVEWVQSYCSTRGGYGGAARVGEGLVLVTYGGPLKPADKFEGSLTTQYKVDEWETSMLRNLTVNGSITYTAASNDSGSGLEDGAHQGATEMACHGINSGPSRRALGD